MIKKSKSKKPKNEELIYSIQEHDASHLHYDLRLEYEGVLKSWAIPKKPPEKPGLKRLAVQTEGHSIDYWDFEGEIKEGYGKGTVKLWDSGKYILLEKNNNKWEIEIKGKKLNGIYVLIKFSSSKGKDNWLFFKKKV